MNSEERFKKSLDELLGSKEFSFDEANWEKAREMIDASKKAKKRRVVPFILSGTLLLISVLTGVYLLSKQNTPSGNLAVSPANNISRVSGSVKVKDDLKVNSLVKPSNSDKKTINNNKPIAFENNSADENRIKTADSPIKNPLPLSTKKITPVVSFVPSNNTPLDNPDKDNHENPTLAIKASPVNASLNTSITNSSQVSEPMDDGSNEGVSALINPSLTSVAEASFIGKESFTEAPKSNTDSDSLQSQLNATSTNADEQTLTSEKSPEVINPVVSNTSATTYTVVKDATDSVLLTNDLGEIGKPKEFPVLFSIEAGTSYLLGWKNPGSRDANGFNPLLGVNYFTGITSKFSLSLGLYYSSVSHLSYSNYTSKITRLTLGEESQVTVFTPVKVHYLIVPLRLHYNIDAKNTIGLGCNLAYLLNVESEVESYSQKLNTTSDYSISKTTGYTEGFKKYDTQVSVFYRKRFYPNLSANVELFYGLTDIKDNRFFNSNVMERNTGIKLTLVYNILKK